MCAQTRYTVVQMVTNVEDRKKLPPNDEQFPYSLEVDDHTDTYQYSTTDAYPRNGWACLWRHDSTEPVSDANPYPAEYIQEQSFTRDDWHDQYDDEAGRSLAIADPSIMYPHKVTDTDGWDTGPGRLWDFFETVRDNYYEYSIDPTTLPVRVILHRKDNPSDYDPFDEYGEIYFRNSDNDIEYIMWSSNELYQPRHYTNYCSDTDELDAPQPPNSELIQKILTAFANAYEDPREFLSNWSGRAYPI